ncbi:hypothetical protein [Mycolicibacterium sp. HK-90]|uniref:hypothetical protein n=1 Tax=Mycolicibacterium sp. HK-90 TaxID=3056937 RepID=UPI002657BDD9|nr:hypothetical protein [Mycolicibacterium sp. HK-90]WKG03060.1 hypothetical protein QU592_28390 [Mycolicibacterium sp. HK-90]
MLKLWNGTEFVTPAALKVWNGTAFVDPEAYIWDGSQFVKVWPPTPISFVGGYGLYQTSLSSIPVPAHQEGDTILFWSMLNSNTSSNTPSLAPGFTSLFARANASSQQSRGVRLAMKVAESSSETIDGLSQTSAGIVLVYRGVAGIGTLAANHPTGSQLTLNYPAAPLTNTDGTSWGVRFRASSGSSDSNPSLSPSTLRAGDDPEGDSFSAGYDSNGPISSGIAVASQAQVSGVYCAVSLELLQHT